MTGAITVMKHTEFDLGQLAGLREWQRDEGDNSERLRRLRRRLPDAMADLTPRQQQMLSMRFEQNMSVTEIARELGLNCSTVSRTLRRAQERLRRCLQYAL